MNYEMKKIGGYDKVSLNTLREMYNTIMLYIKGNHGIFSERGRQFFTWGAKTFKYIASTDGCYGIQFSVSGLKHRGRVRIYYNPASDYFDVEFIRARKEELVEGFEDIDFEQLHNVCHRHIERTDDPEV